MVCAVHTVLRDAANLYGCLYKSLSEFYLFCTVHTAAPAPQLLGIMMISIGHNSALHEAAVGALSATSGSDVTTPDVSGSDVTTPDVSGSDVTTPDFSASPAAPSDAMTAWRARASTRGGFDSPPVTSPLTPAPRVA